MSGDLRGRLAGLAIGVVVAVVAGVLLGAVTGGSDDGPVGPVWWASPFGASPATEVAGGVLERPGASPRRPGSTAEPAGQSGSAGGEASGSGSAGPDAPQGTSDGGGSPSLGGGRVPRPSDRQPSTATDWSRERPASSAFSVEMPPGVESQRDTRPTEDGVSISYEILVADRGRWAAGAADYEIPEGSSLDMRRGVDGAVANLRGTVTDYQPTKFGFVDSATFSATGTTQGVAVVMIGRMIQLPGRLAMLFVLAEPDAEPIAREALARMERTFAAPG